MLTLYVNGDSHSAEVYTADIYGYPGKSFSEQLAEKFSAQLINHSLPGGSNQRIIRTSEQALSSLDPSTTLVLIGWTSFERAEWFFDQHWHNVAASEAYTLSSDILDIGQRHLENYRTNMAYCLNCHLEQHQNIWNFHNRLTKQGYRFLFFQACETFFFDGMPEQDRGFELDWAPGSWAHNPYVQLQPDNSRHVESFSHLCNQQGFQYVDKYAHHGLAANTYWADFLTPKINNLINI
jgi:hypothetical protein